MDTPGAGEATAHRLDDRANRLSEEADQVCDHGPPIRIFYKVFFVETARLSFP